MQPSVEILDHIFSFVSDRETLVACSKDPILSLIVERHLYYNVVVQISGSRKPRSKYNNFFQPDQLSRLVSENPRILSYVRILQIRAEHMPHDGMQEVKAIRERLDKFASTLLMFPMLECIMLIASQMSCVWYWTDIFQAALEDRLNLPTLTEVQLVGCRNFPSSLLNKCKNIKNLSLRSEQPFEVAEDHVSDPTLPRLKSLTLWHGTPHYETSSSLLAWLKCHVSELQSLKCVTFPAEMLPELLGACAGTLNSLELYLGYTCYHYSSQYIFRTGGIEIKHFPELPIIPKNVQQLTIHAKVYLDTDNFRDPTMPTCCISCLPAAAEAIKLFTPSLQHLVLDVDIGLMSLSDLTKIDFSPLLVLGAASLSIPRIDLYVHTGIAPYIHNQSAYIHNRIECIHNQTAPYTHNRNGPYIHNRIGPAALTRAQLISFLGNDEDMMRSIEEGRLVIHLGPEETAPGALW